MNGCLKGGRASGRASGFTFVEVLVVLVLMGLAAAITAAAWQRAVSRTATMQAARMTQKSLIEARMLAVYRGINHFVVVDPTEHTIEIFEDSSTPFGELDDADPRVRIDAWPHTVDMQLPGAASWMPNPLGGSALVSPWSLPPPEGAIWGDTLRGVLATPRGSLASVESNPEVISSGVIVFSDGRGETASVGIRGQFGTARWFRWIDGAWKRG